MATIEDRLQGLRILADELRGEIAGSTLLLLLDELLEELNEEALIAGAAHGPR
jgi:hypothetical protein